MKRNLSLLFIVVFGFSRSLVAQESVQPNVERAYDPLVVAVIMIKDEQDVIQPTLQPLADGGIKDFFVYDTGSTDNTIARVKEFFVQNNHCTAYLAQGEFVDFATSRNHALEAAEKKFPDAAFMLMPDAEWYLKNVEKLIKFCAQGVDRLRQGLGESIPTSFLVRIMHPSLDFYTPRLIRCGTGVRFCGEVHEVLMPASGYRIPPDIYFELGPSRAGLEKSRRRWARDRDILLKKVEQNSKDTRSLFYLAQTCECLGDFENAYRYYNLRIQLTGWPEEDYMAVYRQATIVEFLAKKEDSSLTWEDARQLYERAFRMRPGRAEPLIKLAQHYLQEDDDHQFAFLYAQRAAQIPYPANDVLFVEKDEYEYTRFDILGRCAWYVGQYDMGEAAIKNALKRHPNYDHLKINLIHYLNRKKALSDNQ